ncbi:MAG TPA: response regulator [Methanomicrobiales archaeon]|nr:response regulator [Methanomicrobiales archaeon]
MKVSILVVEDEFITAEDIGNRLKGMGYDVSAIADNGEEAIRKAGELRPSLVLMDIGLAGKMNGIEAGKRIRERFDLPVVYLTGHHDESTFWDALASEPYGYVLKPFETSEMKFAIEMALQRHGEARSASAKTKRKIPKGLPRALLLVFVALGILLVIAFAVGPFRLSPLGAIGLPAPSPAVNTQTQAPDASPAGGTQYDKNVAIVEEIAKGYHDTHTYLGVQTGQSSDIFVCIDMAKDVWNMVKTRGINAVIEVGNVDQNVTALDDVNHAWVLAEVGPLQWLAIETTGGYVVPSAMNPRYYTGVQFQNPADMKQYLCGQTYCWSNTCVNDQCQPCRPGYVLGTDLQCHLECGSGYCMGNEACTNGRCQKCDSGFVLGPDGTCHPTCIDSNHYCLSGYVCGTDYRCHPV